MVLRKRKDDGINNSNEISKTSSDNDLPPPSDHKVHFQWASLLLLSVASAATLQFLVSNDMLVLPAMFTAAQVPASPNNYTIPSSLSNEEVPPHYESSMMQIVPQVFLLPTQCDSYAITAARPSNISVTTVMNISGKTHRTAEQLFVMLNGQNEGVYVTWKGNWACLYEAVKVATKALGADADWMTEGLRVLSPMGIALTTVQSIEDADRRVHVLFDNQIWYVNDH